MTEPTAPATTAAPEAVTEPVRSALFGPGRRATTVGLVLLTLVTAFEAMGVGTAMPAVIADLGAVSAYGWPFSAFLAASVLGTVVGGRWCDLAGPRPALLVTPLLFAAGLIVAGTAGTLAQLLVGRVLQGASAGTQFVAVFVTIAAIYPERSRPAVFGLMIGHGMMGIWHSEALQRTPDAVLHTVVGRPPKPAAADAAPTAGRAQSSTEAFAQKYGYKKWTTNLDEALADPEVDIVIIAGPSETHAEMSLKSITAGKHTLVEIPIAMNLEGAEAVVAAAREKGLFLGVSHPMRYRAERHDMVRRVAEGQEKIHSVQGRFFIHRLQNVGATGLQRSWTDNILWHHTTHLVDIGLWTVAGGDMSRPPHRRRGREAPLRRCASGTIQ